MTGAGGQLRPFTETLVVRTTGNQKSRGVRTVVPKELLGMLDMGKRTMLLWSNVEPLFRIVPVDEGTPGSRRLSLYTVKYMKKDGTPVSNTTATVVIPMDVASALQAGDGSQVTWYIGCMDGGRWGVYVGRGGGVLGSSARRPGIPPRGAAVTGWVIATSSAKKLADHGRLYVKMHLPRKCMNIIGITGREHVRWVRSGRSWRLEPCSTGDPDARPVQVWAGKDGPARFTLLVYGRMAGVLCPGEKSAIEWRVNSDGNGSWEILARRTGR